MTPEHAEIRSMANVPLKVHGRVIGYIGILSRKARFINEEHVRQLQIFADQSAAVLENARLSLQSQQRAMEAETLRQAGAALSSTLSRQEIFAIVLEQMKKVVDFDSGSVQILSGDRYEMVSVIGFPDPNLTLTRTILAEAEAEKRMMQTGEAVISADVERDFVDFTHPPHAKVKSWLAVPVFYGGEILGKIACDRYTDRPFTPRDARLATNFAQQLGLALENARLYEEAQRSTVALESLRKAAEAVAGMTTLREVIECILEQFHQVVPMDSGSIILLEDNDWRMAGCWGFSDPETVLTLRFDREDVLLNRIHTTRRPITLADVLVEPEFKNYLPQQTRGWLGVPIIFKDRFLGVFTIDSHQVGFFDQSHLHLAESFADQMAAMIENARLYEESQLRAAEAESLREASAAVAAELTEKNVLARILEQVGRLVAFDSASVQLLKDNQLHIVATSGFSDPELYTSLTFSLGDDRLPSSQAVRTRRPVVIADTRENPTFVKPSHNVISSWMGIPLIYRDEVIGLMTLDSREPGFYNDAHARLAEKFASQAAIALANARLHEESEARRA
jgi:GAF domain-containing protein